MNLGLETISIRKKDFNQYGHNSYRNETLQIAFTTQLGQRIFDIRNLSAPAEYLSNGYELPSTRTLQNLNLLAQRKRIKLISTLNGELIQSDSFIITSPYTFILTGGYDPTGTDLDEILILYVDTIEKVALQQVEEIRKTYVLPAGQTQLNLGFSYEVNKNPGQQLGEIKVIRLGKLMYRNENNVPADPVANGNYEEVNSGNGYGTSIEFNVAPTEDEIVSVEYGFKTGDANIEVLSAMERIQSTVIAVAQDVAEGMHGDEDLSRYLTASPNEIERLTFGNQVIENTRRIDNLIIGNSTVADAFKKFSSDSAFETIKGRQGEEGDVYFNTTSKDIRYHNGTLWGSIGSGSSGATAQEEQFPVTSAIISDGYIDLSYAAADHSLHFWAVSGAPYTLNYDYTLSVVSGKTRITFLSSITSSITTNDVLITKYSI